MKLYRKKPADDGCVRAGRHRPSRVDEPHDSLRLRQRPVWLLQTPTSTGRHHVVSGRSVAALATPGEATQRALRAIPQQQRRAS